MRRVILVSMLMSIMLGGAVWAAETPASATGEACVPRLNLIRVTGFAAIKVMPDTARLQFTVQQQDPALPQARQKAAAAMQQLLAAIKVLKLEGLTLSTAGVNVTPLYAPLRQGESGYVPGGEVARRVVGYAVSNTVSATIHGDADALRQGVSQIVDLALTSPTVDLSGPEFSKEDLTTPHQEGLEKAVRDAIGNAQAMARGMGVTITGYNWASMYSPEPSPPQPMMYEKAMMAPGAGGGTPTPVEVEAQELDVTVYLDAEY